MNNFYITPLTGNTLGTISVTPLQANTTPNDKVNVAVVENGMLTKTVTLTQYGLPSIVLVEGDPDMSADGGIITYNVSSHYPFGFSNIPNWITVTDSNGNTYTNDTQYTVVGTKLLTFTVAPNLSENNRTSSGLEFHFWKGGSIDSHRTAITITQEGMEEEDYIIVTPNPLYLDAMQGSYGTLTVDANVPYHYAADTGIQFMPNPTGNTIRCSVAQANNFGEFKMYNNTFSGGNAETIHSVIQYPYPTIEPNGSIDYNVLPQGDVKFINISSKYPWYMPSSDYIAYTSNGLPVSTNSSNPMTAGDYTVSAVWSRNKSGSARSVRLSPMFIHLNGATSSSVNSIGAFVQNSSSQYIDVDKSSFDVEPAGLVAAEINVDSDLAWTATTDSDWIEEVRGWSSTGGETVLLFNVKPNLGLPRNGNITLTSAYVTKRITIYQ